MPGVTPYQDNVRYHKGEEKRISLTCSNQSQCINIIFFLLNSTSVCTVKPTVNEEILVAMHIHYYAILFSNNQSACTCI